MKKLLLLIILLPVMALGQDKISPKDVNQEVLSSEIEILKTQVDSLKNINNSIELKYDASKHLEVVNQINDFYDSAWLKLVLYLGAISIIVPLIIQWMQQRNFKSSENRIFNELDKRFHDKLLFLQKENKSELDKLEALFKEKMNDLSNQNNEELATLNSIFEDKTEELRSDYIYKTKKIEANLFISRAHDYEVRKDYNLAALYFYIAACMMDGYETTAKIVNLHLENFLRNVSIGAFFKNIEQNDKVLLKLTKSSFKDNFEKLSNSLFFKIYEANLNKIKEITDSN